MDLNLSGKLALITGGSRGIGRAVGEALAAEGCSLVLVSRSATDLATARKQIEEKYQVSVRTDAADLADGANVRRLAAQFPDVDILVNNAGAIPGGTLFDVDEAPASSVITTPLVLADCDDARKATMAAISAGAPTPPRGRDWNSSGQRDGSPNRSCARLPARPTTRSVAVGPGLTPITRMPSRTLPLPSDSVNAVSPALPVTPQM